MEEHPKCERCGTWLSVDNPEGLCSSCLFSFGIHGFDDEELAVRTSEARSTSRPGLCDLGDYELLGEIARGGMGVVYRARQKSLDRVVAVKLILVGKWASPVQLERFKAEAASVSRLDHPNIVPIYEISESAGQHFFSMKLLEGGNLAQRMSDFGPPNLDFQRVAHLVALLARAVHYAHQHGVIHRDLKPTNTLIDRQGQPHITDFGLAKIFDEDGTSSISAEILGTPAYMAPEQAAGRGARITTAADIYSLGAILYEILTGRPPFTGSSIQVLQAACEREPEPILKLRPAVPYDLEVICLRCLNKEPSHRYGSAEALAEDLDRWQAGEPIHARSVPAAERVWLWARRKPVTAGLMAALILLAAIASIGSAVMAKRIATARDQATTLAETNRRQLVELNLANGLRLIESGNRFESLPWLVEALRLDADAPLRQRNHRIRLASLLQGLPQPRQIFFHDEPVTDAALSPLGFQVAVASGNRIYLWNRDSGNLALPPLDHPPGTGEGSGLFHGAPVSQLAFSPDGGLLLGVCGDYVQLWNALTGQRIGEPLRHKVRILHALFASEGKEVLAADEDGTITRWSTESGQQLGVPLHVGTTVYGLALHSGRNLLATASIQSGTRLWNLADWKPAGEPLLHGWAVFHVAFSPDGKSIATAGGDNQGRLWDATSGKPIGRIFWHKDHVVQVVFSSDGKHLATVSRDHTAKVWSLSDDTHEPLTLVHGGPVSRAEFSPDGAWIATASADNTAQVWDVFDGRPITPPLLHNNAVIHVSFSKDGKRLLTASADGTARVWDLPAATITQMLFRDAWWFFTPPSVSPSGRYAVLMDPTDTALIWDAATERILSPALRHPKPAFLGSVSEDAQLAVTACHDEQVRLWDVTTGKPLGNPISFRARHLAILSPNRQYLVLADDHGAARVWDLNTRLILAGFASPEKPPLWGTFAPDSRRFVICGQSRTARVYDIDSKRQVGLLIHDAPVTAVAFAPVGDFLASGDESGQALVWSPAGQQPIARLTHPRRINALAFSPDARRLLTASEDGDARLWEISSESLLLPPLHNSSPLRSVVFSPDAQRAITVDMRLDPQMWELDTGHPLTPPRRYHTQIETNSRTTLAGPTVSWNWNLPADDRPVEELVTEALALSGRKLDHLGGLSLLDRNDFKAVWKAWRAKHP